MGYSYKSLAALLASSVVVSALQMPLQMPFDLPNKLPWNHEEKSDTGLSADMVDSDKLQARISGKRLMSRAEDLYELARKSEDEFNHPTRVIGSQGHAATLEYLTRTLEDLDGYYEVWTQQFPAVMGNVFESRLVLGDEVWTGASPMGLTPPTRDREPVHGDLILVEGGCQAADYPGSVRGNVVLVQRGECSFGQKSELSGQAGAVAAIIYNTEKGNIHGTLGDPSANHVATFGLSGKEGERFAKKLRGGEHVDVIAYIDSEVKRHKTTNVLAQTVQGDPGNCVMLGGHSDGVADGPGINDDGSGSMSLLEIATQLTHFNVSNCVRFAWWSAEEEGLLGSDFYVASLSKEERRKIRLFMDYDMMASPNFAYQIYDANNEDNPVGSYELKRLYADWYTEQGLNFTYIPFDGRSDYDAFIRGGIPGGGIATGAEGVKTEEEAAMFGGKAGDWYDPCYHQHCDDLSNLNLTAWEVNTKLIAHSVATYAKSFDGFPQQADDFQVASYGESVMYHGNKLVV